MSSGRKNYAKEGKVIELTNGSAGLEDILDSAWCYDYAVLIDFTVPWCGPCRMLAPVLAQQASTYKGTVAVVKVDCEATAENRNLASSQGISAYPTLKLYSDKVMRKEIRGLQRQELISSLTAESEAALERQSKMKASRAAFEVAGKLADEMEKMKEKQDEYQDFVTMCRICLTYLRNIALHPEEEKYRRIRVSNKHFAERLGSKPGGIECMRIIGFEEVAEDDGENWLVMNTVPATLPTVAKLLAQAVPPAHAIGPTSSTNNSRGSQVSAQQLSNMLQNILGGSS